MVDVDVAGGGPLAAVVRADPRAAGRGAPGVGDDVCAVALEDRLARGAPAGGAPVREEVAGVAVLRALRGDGQAAEGGFGGVGAGDVGGGAGLEGGGGGEGEGEEGGEDGEAEEGTHGWRED